VCQPLELYLRWKSLLFIWGHQSRIRFSYGYWICLSLKKSNFWRLCLLRNVCKFNMNWTTYNDNQMLKTYIWWRHRFPLLIQHEVTNHNTYSPYSRGQTTRMARNVSYSTYLFSPQYLKWHHLSLSLVHFQKHSIVSLLLLNVFFDALYADFWWFHRGHKMSARQMIATIWNYKV